jgi:phage-related protein
MEAKGSKVSSLAHLTLQLNHGKILKLNADIKAGQFLVCDGNSLYITDESWNKISDINISDIPLLISGNNEITVGGGFSNDPAFSLSFLFSVRGVPEQLGY